MCRKGRKMDTKQSIEKLLNDVFLTDGCFDYGTALDRITRMHKVDNTLSLLEYLNLLDALNKKLAYGNYNESIIMKRALNS